MRLNSYPRPLCIRNEEKRLCGSLSFWLLRQFSARRNMGGKWCQGEIVSGTIGGVNGLHPKTETDKIGDTFQRMAEKWFLTPFPPCGNSAAPNSGNGLHN